MIESLHARVESLGLGAAAAVQSVVAWPGVHEASLDRGDRLLRSSCPLYCGRDEWNEGHLVRAELRRWRRRRRQTAAGEGGRRRPGFSPTINCRSDASADHTAAPSTVTTTAFASSDGSSSTDVPGKPSSRSSWMRRTRLGLYLRPAVPVCQHLELMGPNEMPMVRLSAIVESAKSAWFSAPDTKFQVQPQGDLGSPCGESSKRRMRKATRESIFGPMAVAP